MKRKLSVSTFGFKSSKHNFDIVQFLIATINFALNIVILETIKTNIICRINFYFILAYKVFGTFEYNFVSRCNILCQKRQVVVYVDSIVITKQFKVTLVCLAIYINLSCNICNPSYYNIVFLGNREWLSKEVIFVLSCSYFDLTGKVWQIKLTTLVCHCFKFAILTHCFNFDIWNYDIIIFDNTRFIKKFVSIKVNISRKRINKNKFVAKQVSHFGNTNVNNFAKFVKTIISVFVGLTWTYSTINRCISQRFAVRSYISTKWKFRNLGLGKKQVIQKWTTTYQKTYGKHNHVHKPISPCHNLSFFVEF